MKLTHRVVIAQCKLLESKWRVIQPQYSVNSFKNCGSQVVAALVFFFCVSGISEAQQQTAVSGLLHPRKTNKKDRCKYTRIIIGVPSQIYHLNIFGETKTRRQFFCWGTNLCIKKPHTKKKAIFTWIIVTQKNQQ